MNRGPILFAIFAAAVLSILFFLISAQHTIGGFLFILVVTLLAAGFLDKR